MKICLFGMLIVFTVTKLAAQVDSSTFMYIKKNKAQYQPLFINIDTINNKQKPGTNIRICVPSKQSLLNLPLFIVKSHNQTFCFTDTNSTKLPNINPKWIKKIDILKNSNALDNYGTAGKNGVVEITLDDEKYPDAYKSIVTVIKKQQP